MPGRPMFSVVVPTYDRPDLLQEAVASVVAQTVDDWECLVIDDCGTVELPDLHDSRVRVHRRAANGGAAAALNTGVERSTGGYVTMLADDDVWTPNRLQLAVSGLERAPLAMCWSGFMGESRPDKGRDLEGDVSDTILDTTVPSMGTVALRRDLWLPLRADYRTCEDVDWWLRTAPTTPVHTVREVGYLVRRHDGVRHLSGVEVRYQDTRRLLEDHAGWFDAHPVALAFRLRRVAHFACLVGEHRDAVRALTTSMRLDPSLRTAKQLALASLRRPARLQQP